MAVYLAVLTNLKWRCVNIMENVFTPINPSSADPTQFQWRHTGTHGKPAWQDLRSNSSWCAKASHEAAETSSSKGIIILNCHNHHLFRPLWAAVQRSWRASKQERRKMTALISVQNDYSGTLRIWLNKHLKIISRFISRFCFWLLYQLTWYY